MSAKLVFLCKRLLNFLVQKTANRPTLSECCKTDSVANEFEWAAIFDFLTAFKIRQRGAHPRVPAGQAKVTALVGRKKSLNFLKRSCLWNKIKQTLARSQTNLTSFPTCAADSVKASTANLLKDRVSFLCRFILTSHCRSLLSRSAHGRLRTVHGSHQVLQPLRVDGTNCRAHDNAERLQR